MNEPLNPMHRGHGMEFYFREIAPLVKWRQCGDTRVATTADIEAAWREYEARAREPA